jgi:hypothetical protein
MSDSFIVAPVVNTVVTNDECAICLECVNPEKNCCVTDCGHKFHTNCLLKNCEKNNFNCPMCRNNLLEQEKNRDQEENINILDSTFVDINDEMFDRFHNEFLEFIRYEREQLATQTTELTDEQINVATHLAMLLNLDLPNVPDTVRH